MSGDINVLPAGEPPSGEISPLEPRPPDHETTPPDHDAATPGDHAVVSDGQDEIAYTIISLPRSGRGPAELAAARRRAERRAERWERRDAAGPRILETDLLTRGDQVVGFTLTFDSPMRADAANDPNAYRAIRITKPNKWLARLTYQGDGPQVEELRIRSVEYRPEDRMAVVWLQDPRRATGKFRVGVVTHQTPGQRRARPLALGPLTDIQGRIVRHNPADVKLPGRNVLLTQPDHSIPYNAPRIRGV